MTSMSQRVAAWFTVLSITFGIFGYIGKGVWTVASEMSDIKTAVHTNTDLLNKRTELFQTVVDNQKLLLEDVAELNRETMRVVYVNDDHILVKTSDGSTLKIPVTRN